MQVVCRTPFLLSSTHYPQFALGWHGGFSVLCIEGHTSSQKLLSTDHNSGVPVKVNIFVMIYVLNHSSLWVPATS